MNTQNSHIPHSFSQHYILGNKVTAINAQELQAYIAEVVARNGKELILNTNVFGINLACQLQWLRTFRNSASIVYCDGAGVVLGARLLGITLPSRITMADWLWDLAAFCEHKDFSIFFLGGKLGRVELAAQRLKERHPRLRIVGTHHGYFAKAGPECEEVVRMINEAEPNLLIVGFGMPLQESWLRDNYSRIHANTYFAQGAIFDFISGAVQRCPAWMGELGLEWLFRWCLEPKRMFVRYILGNPLFVFRVLCERLSILVGRRLSRKNGLDQTGP